MEIIKKSGNGIVLILLFIAIYTNAQKINRVTFSGFLESGIKYSPLGDYYAYYGTNKPLSGEELNLLPEDCYYINVIRINELSLKKNNFKRYKEYTSVKIASYPYVFIDWRNNNELLLLNIENQTIWVNDFNKNERKFWFTVSKELIENITYSNIALKHIKLKYVDNIDDIVLYYHKENTIFLYYLKTGKSEKINLAKNIIDFDIDFKTNLFAGFVYNEETFNSDLVIYNILNDKEKIIQRNIDDYPQRASLNFSYIGDAFTFKIREDKNSESIDSFYLYDTKKEETTLLFSQKTHFYDIISFEYHPKAKYQIACSLWSKNIETPEKKIKHKDLVLDTATLFYVGMINISK